MLLFKACRNFDSCNSRGAESWNCFTCLQRAKVPPLVKEISRSLLPKTSNNQLQQQNDSRVTPKHWHTSKSSLQESGSPYPLLPTPFVLFEAVAVLILDVHRVILSHAGTFSLHGVKQGQSVEMHEIAH